MPKIDSNAKDVQDFSPIPVGKYLVEVEDIQSSYTNAGDEMWKMKMLIVEGEEEGKYLFDNIVFSEKAMPRAKMICSRFGLDVSKDFDLTEEMLLSRRAIATVDRIESYEKEDGRTAQASRIGFAGYENAPEGKEKGKPKPKKKDDKVF